jgi:hypothetical protein
MDMIYSCGSSSASHTYGNVASAVKEHILSKFPKNYFKSDSIHISTQLAFRYLRDRRLNSNDELYKRTKPLMVIKPIYETPDSGAFTGHYTYKK